MTVAEQFALAVCEPEVTVIVAVLVPAVEYEFAHVEPVPVHSPDHKYVYELEPPETVGVNVIVFPVVVLDGEAKQEAVRFAVGVVTVALQFAVVLCPPEVTVIVEFFVPEIE